MEEDYFNTYVNELNKLYEVDPQKAVDYLSESVDRVSNKETFSQKLGLDEKKLDKICMIILAISLIPIGFINPIDPVYFGGLIFFIAGLMIGLFVPFFGIIFLCSHGGTGLYLMNMSIIEAIQNSPIMGDLSSDTRSYMYGIVGIFIAAILGTLLHNLIPKVREVKYIKTIIMILYVIGILLIKLLPHKLGIDLDINY